MKGTPSLGARHRLRMLTLLSMELCCDLLVDKALLSCIQHSIFGLLYNRLLPSVLWGHFHDESNLLLSSLAHLVVLLCQRGQRSLLRSQLFLITKLNVIHCLSISILFKSQWFIESNAYILYHEIVPQCCQCKLETCCVFLISSNPSKPKWSKFELS